MVGKFMERRKRPQRQRKRNTVATWVAGLFCLVALLFLVALSAADYIKKWEGAQRDLPSLALDAQRQAEEAEGAQTPALPDPYEDDGNWNLRLVNRWNPLPQGYTVNLKSLPGGEQVDQRIYEPLMEMLEAAMEGNWDELPEVVSGYRTQEEQQALYDAEVNKYKGEGYSEEEAKE